MKVSTDVTIATVLSYVFIYGLIWFHMLSFCFFKSVPGVVEHMVQGECSSEHQAHRAQKQRDVKYPRRLPFPKDLACAILNVFTCLQLIHFLDLQTWIPFAFKQSFLPLRLLRLLSLLCRLSSTPQGQNFYLSGTGINCSSTRMHARWNSLSISLSLSLLVSKYYLILSLSLSLPTAIPIRLYNTLLLSNFSQVPVYFGTRINAIIQESTFNTPMQSSCTSSRWSKT